MRSKHCHRLMPSEMKSSPSRPSHLPCPLSLSENIRPVNKANCRCQTIGVSEAGTVPSGSRWAGDAEWEPRAAAVSPGGPFTRRFFAHRPVALQIGGSSPQSITPHAPGLLPIVGLSYF